MKAPKYRLRSLYILVWVLVEQLRTNSICLGNLLSNRSLFFRWLWFLSTVVTRRFIFGLSIRLIRVSGVSRLVARGDWCVGAVRRFVGLDKVIDVDDSRHCNSNSADHFFFWGLLRLLVPNRLALRRIDGFGSKDITTGFWMPCENNGGFAPWRFSTCGWRIVDNYGRSALSTNNGSDSGLRGCGALTKVTSVLENRLSLKIFTSLYETYISGELITRK